MFILSYSDSSPPNAFDKYFLISSLVSISYSLSPSSLSSNWNTSPKTAVTFALLISSINSKYGFESVSKLLNDNKDLVIPYLDYIDEKALSIGAVNTIVNKNNKLYGYNTDYFGFGATFERKGISFKCKTAVILGYGGACRAALSYILNDNTTIPLILKNIKGIKNFNY